MNVCTRKAFDKIRAFYILLLLPLLLRYTIGITTLTKEKNIIFRITYYVQDCIYEKAKRILDCGMQRSFRSPLIKAIFARLMFFESPTKKLRESRRVTPEVKFARYRNYANCSPVLTNLRAFTVLGSASKTVNPCAASHLSLCLKLKRFENVNHFRTKGYH